MVQVNHCIEDQQFRMEGRSRMMRRRMSRDSSQNLYIGQKLLIVNMILMMRLLWNG